MRGAQNVPSGACWQRTCRSRAERSRSLFAPEKTLFSYKPFSYTAAESSCAVKFKTIRGQIIFKSAAGAALAVLVGLILWKTPKGEPWVNLSYDYLFPFSARVDTNQVILILMDNDAYDYYHQERGSPWWDRAL